MNSSHKQKQKNKCQEDMSSAESFLQSSLGFVQSKCYNELVLSQILEDWLYLRLGTKWSFWDPHNLWVTKSQFKCWSVNNLTK